MHVDSQLSSLLISLLEHYHVIELDGLGIIQQHRIEARMSHVDKATSTVVLLPPQLGFVYKPNEKMDTNTLVLARSEGQLLDQDYERLLTFVNALRNQSQTENTVLSADFHTTKGYLDEIRIEEIDRVSEVVLPEIEQEVTMSPTISKQLSPKESIDIAIHQKKEIPREHLITEPSDEQGWINSVLPLLLLVAGIFGMTVIYKQCSKEVPENPHPITEVKELMRAEDDVNPLDADEPVKIFDNPRLEKYRHILTQDIIKDGCKIAVGSFKEERNATNMMERVLTEGYNSEIMSFAGGTRVIITFDCLSEDLDNYLLEVKGTIAPNAWYLQPDYEPELD